MLWSVTRRFNKLTSCLSEEVPRQPEFCRICGSASPATPLNKPDVWGRPTPRGGCSPAAEEWLHLASQG